MLLEPKARLILRVGVGRAGGGNRSMAHNALEAKHMETDLLAVYTTLPGRDAADQLATSLVEDRLAACANCFPVDSVYSWQGQIERAGEWAVVLKTRRELWPRVRDRIRAIHPYEVPAIVAYGVAEALPEYAEWVRASTRERP
jgi:periplasmic divalent cation tolerance protein